MRGPFDPILSTPDTVSTASALSASSPARRSQRAKPETETRRDDFQTLSGCALSGTAASIIRGVPVSCPGVIRGLSRFPARFPAAPYCFSQSVWPSNRLPTPFFPPTPFPPLSGCALSGTAASIIRGVPVSCPGVIRGLSRFPPRFPPFSYRGCLLDAILARHHSYSARFPRIFDAGPFLRSLLITMSQKTAADVTPQVANHPSASKNLNPSGKNRKNEKAIMAPMAPPPKTYAPNNETPDRLAKTCAGSPSSTPAENTNSHAQAALTILNWYRGSSARSCSRAPNNIRPGTTPVPITSPTATRSIPMQFVRSGILGSTSGSSCCTLSKRHRRRSDSCSKARSDQVPFRSQVPCLRILHLQAGDRRIGWLHRNCDPKRRPW